VKGYRVHEWGGGIVWEDVPPPIPEPGDVVVAVEACGIGLTVLNWINGDLANDPTLLPRAPGHELVGVVEEAIPPADPALVGQRVIAHAYLFCGRCSFCRSGRESNCIDLRGWIGIHRDGGYVPATAIPASNVVVIEPDVDPVEATVIPDAVSTSVHVCRQRARVSLDDRVVVIGAAGGVGIHMIQVARALGAKVYGADIGGAKLDAIDALGVVALDAADPDRLIAGFEVDRATVVVDLVGSESTHDLSFRIIGMGGRLVHLTTFAGQSVRFAQKALVMNEISVLASKSATLAEYRTAADLVARGRVRPVIGSVVGAEDVPAVHEALRESRLVGRGALTWTQSHLATPLHATGTRSPG
jgi:propanol-preferring alcohol dehydrogenase